MTRQLKPNLENGLWKYDLTTSHYSFSIGVCKIFNLRLQDLNSHNAFLKWIHPADIDCYTSSFNEKINTSQPFTLCFRIILQNGTVKDIEESIDFIMDEKGKVISYYGIVSDITMLNVLQNERQEKYTLINSILKTLPNLIFVKNIDAGFKFTLVNDNFASFYGLTSAEVIGKYDKDISTPEQANACYITDNIAARHSITSPVISVEEIPVSQNSIKYMQTIKYAHTINGTNYLICSAMDITDLVIARQKAEESDKLKSSFLSTISHEVRTPMNSVMGFSQLMCDSKNEDERALYCENINNGCVQLLNLITDIVYLSKLESSNQKFIFEDTNIKSLFAIMKSQYEKQMKNKKLNFIYTPHDAPCTVSSNKDGIMEIMKHFLDNAIKFTEKGSVSMGYDMENKVLKIWVKDTGIGFDMKDRKKVFNRFVKLNDFATGTGIGLYIAQKVAKSMKGTIGIDSEPGKGTTVWAELPLDIV